MKLTKKGLIFIILMTACFVMFFIALWRLPVPNNTEYLLDIAGCAAAKRLGAVVAVENGICSVRVIGDSGWYLRLEGGGRLSKDHVLGWRVVK